MLVHRIAMEAAAELIVHAAVGHRAQRFERHVERFLTVSSRVVAEQEIEHYGAGKFRCVAEAAMRGVEDAAEMLEGRVQDGLVGDAPRPDGAAVY